MKEVSNKDNLPRIITNHLFIRLIRAIRGKRVGFLKGQISVPVDFDIMGQNEITAAFF